MEGYHSNIEKETLKNNNYRKVLFTGKNMQLVVMSLKPHEDIPREVHENIDQFIRVEEGECLVDLENEEYYIKEDEVVIIPAGTEHYVKNTSSKKDLKLYSIYTPPEHTHGTVHKTKEESDADEHH